MFQIVSAQDAVKFIQNGDCICINCFLAMANPSALHRGIAQRFLQTGSPGNLTLLCASGYGNWTPDGFGEALVSAGAVSRVIASHFSSMPTTTGLIRENRIQGYALPLGVISHAIRAMAGGHEGYLSRVGLGIYVDPRLEGPGMNPGSTQSLVSLVQVEGQAYLFYRLPKINVALIKGTSVDPNGNIGFEDEVATVDALNIAMAAKQNGGRVLVQVDHVTHTFSRPWNVILPGSLVDAVVVEEAAGAFSGLQAMNGDIHVPPTHMDYWMNRLSSSRSQRDQGPDRSAAIIGARGAQELRPGSIANIGLGLPEMVGKYAARCNVLKDVTLTVESGGFGGLPAGGRDFGATIGADMIVNTSTQMDFYEGGGLDVCFMGALEVDCRGNVNVHRRGDSYVGVGGFADLTQATRKVVFCLTFTAKGLEVHEDDGLVTIAREGSIPKFKREIQSISFCAEDAIRQGHQVLYITDRCVFELTEQGLRLLEVYSGVDRQRDILDRLEFPICLD